MGKEKETALPKNIRQIGEIRGAEKICIEDYVMTCIHKKEPQEKDGYLGIFYGYICFSAGFWKFRTVRRKRLKRSWRSRRKNIFRTGTFRAVV